MDIARLQEAADRLLQESEFVRREYEAEDHDDPDLRRAIDDGYELGGFVLMFLDTTPIDEQWLRETWDVAWSKIYGYWFGCGGELKFWPTVEGVNHIWIRIGMRDFRSDSLTRGQFTALMFGLGQYPKDK